MKHKHRTGSYDNKSARIGYLGSIIYVYRIVHCVPIGSCATQWQMLTAVGWKHRCFRIWPVEPKDFRFLWDNRCRARNRKADKIEITITVKINSNWIDERRIDINNDALGLTFSVWQTHLMFSGDNLGINMLIAWWMLWAMLVNREPSCNKIEDNKMFRIWVRIACIII